VVPLQPSECTDLGLLAALAPLMATDLRLPHSERLLATDASDGKLAGCYSPIHSSLHQECFRLRDRRGGATKLSSKLEALLSSLGVEEDPIPPHVPSAALPGFAGAGPSRVLIECFDFVEVCCGPRAPLSRAMAARGLRVGPYIDLQQHEMWDFTSPRVLGWLLHLVARDRIAYLHISPPCTTFSIAKQPRLRSRSQPFGFRRDEAQTKAGNLTLLRAAVLARAVRQLGSRHCSVEHPASAYSWSWDLFAGQFDATIRYDVCAFQLDRLAPEFEASRILGEQQRFANERAIVRKRSRLGLVRAPFLHAMARTCCGHHPHSSCDAACKRAEYDPYLCDAWADAAAGYLRREPPLGVQDLAEAERAGVPRLERLLYNELAYAGSWEQHFVCPANTHEHINISEMRSISLALHRASVETPCCRQMCMADSRVAACAFSKGRSASLPLNSVLRRTLPAIVGGHISPGYGFFPTRLNVPDDLTRDKEVRPSRSPESPLAPLLREPDRDDPALIAQALSFAEHLAELPTQPSKHVSEWALLTTRLLHSCSGGTCAPARR
jgi:hypothetical protein